MNNLHITSALPVSLNNYLKARVIYTMIKGVSTPMPSMYETTDAKKFKKYFKSLLAKTVKELNWKVESEHRDKFYIVDAVWYFEKQNRDANNMWKIMLDAITETGLIWGDDRQVLERTNRIFYDSKNPRVEIDIQESAWFGIFDNADIHDSFLMKNCDCCGKKTGKCTVITEALEARITEDIDLDTMTCHKIQIPKPKSKSKKK